MQREERNVLAEQGVGLLDGSASWNGGHDDVGLGYVVERAILGVDVVEGLRIASSRVLIL